MVPNIVLHAAFDFTNHANMAMKVATDRLMINMRASTTTQSMLIKCWSFFLWYFYVCNFVQTTRRLSRNSKTHHLATPRFQCQNIAIMPLRHRFPAGGMCFAGCCVKLGLRTCCSNKLQQLMTEAITNSASKIRWWYFLVQSHSCFFLVSRWCSHYRPATVQRSWHARQTVVWTRIPTYHHALANQVDLSIFAACSDQCMGGKQILSPCYLFIWISWSCHSFHSE